MNIQSLLYLLLPMFAAASVAAQQPNAFDLIPEAAEFVVRLQAPEQTVKEVANFVDRVQPGFGPVVEGQAAGLGQVIQNPTLAGVDRTKDWYLFALPEPGPNPSDSPPEAVYLIPVTDADAAREAMGDRFSYAEKSGYLAWSEEAALIEDVKACFDGTAAAISQKMDADSTKMMSAAHLTVFINAQALKITYADQLAQADEKLEEALESLSEQIRMSNPGIDPEMAVGMYRGMGKCLIQAIRDSESAVASINIANDVLQIEELVTVKEGSSSDEYLKKQPLSDMARLTSIPPGLDGYFGMSVDVTPLIGWAMDMIDSAVTDETIKEKFSKTFEQMADIKFGTYVGGGGFDLDQDEAMQLFGIMDTTPAAKLRSAFMEYQTDLEYEIGGIKQKQSFKPDAEAVDGQTIDHYLFEQTIPSEMDPTGMQAAMNARFYGEEGMLQRLVFKDDLIVTTAGGGVAAMKQLLTASQSTDEKLLKARGSLHEKANLLMLTDVPNIVLDFAKLMLETGVLPVPVQAEQLEPLKIPSSYAGFSMAAAPQQLHFRTNVPVETFQGFALIGMFVQGLMMAN